MMDLKLEVGTPEETSYKSHHYGNHFWVFVFSSLVGNHKLIYAFGPL